MRAILVVSLDNVGDLVFASALFPRLRERYPGARLGLWCKRYSGDIAHMIPEIDSIHQSDPFWDHSPGGGRGETGPFLRVMRRLRRERFDAAILARAPWRTTAAVAALGIPLSVGLERHRSRRWLTHALPPEDETRPALAELGRLLVAVGARGSGLRYRLDERAHAPRRQALAASLGSAPIAALHPFAGHPSRCVAPAQWTKLAHYLADTGFRPFFVGTPAELGRFRAGEGWMEGAVYGDRIGATLLDNALAISLSALFVGHDSGPMHIASAFGVPTVGVFAPGQPSRTFPQGRGPWRMVAAESPAQITADDMLHAAMELNVTVRAAAIRFRPRWTPAVSSHSSEPAALPTSSHR